MKKAALSLAFVFMFGTIAVMAQNPKTDAKKKVATEQKTSELQKPTKTADAETQEITKKKHDKKTKKKAIKKSTKHANKKAVKKTKKPAETTTDITQ
ncbi:MAG: hypothetical protein WCP69_03125 [Bacteroidota bacterium]